MINPLEIVLQLMLSARPRRGLLQLMRLGVNLLVKNGV
jgi:hypothetical protein